MESLVESTTACDDCVLLGVSASGADFLHFVNDRETIKDLAEDNVVAVEPGSRTERDEELRAVCVWSSIGHGEKVRLGVVDLEVLIGKSFSVDALSSSAVTSGEVTSLCHEARNNAVEGAAHVVEVITLGALTSVALSKTDEVVDSPGDDVTKETESDATCGLVVDLNIEVDFVGHSIEGGGERVSEQACEDEGGFHLIFI